jgi:hypothetical protein
MKSLIVNKENYSLQNIENYKQDFNCDVSEICGKVSELLIEYFKFIVEKLKIKNKNLYRFIIIRGLDTITNVFLNILYFTKNVDLTYFHSQKSYYFYIEFVSQISDDEKMFLKLTTRDATTYVYKKTIFDVNNEFKRFHDPIPDGFTDKMDTIRVYINLYQTYFLKIIQSENIDLTHIFYISKICEKLNKFKNKNQLQILENITEKLYIKIDDINKFIEICDLICKKITKNPDLLLNIESKNIDDNIYLMSSNCNSKFVNWILSPD